MSTLTLVLGMVKAAATDLVDESVVFGTNFDLVDTAWKERIVCVKYGAQAGWQPPLLGSYPTGVLVPGFKANTLYKVSVFFTMPTRSNDVRISNPESYMLMLRALPLPDTLEIAPMAAGGGTTIFASATNKAWVCLESLITSDASGQIFIGLANSAGTELIGQLRIIAEKQDN